SLSRILPSVRDGDHLIEAFFPGDGVGVSVLASRGKVLQAFQHRRVHEWNGNGYYRVSAKLSPPLVEATQKIIGPRTIPESPCSNSRSTASRANGSCWKSMPAPGVRCPCR